MMAPVVTEDYGVISIELTSENKPVFHFESYKFSHNIYKRILDDFSEVLYVLHLNGYDRAYVLADKNNTKLHKFCHMFGFSIDGELPNSDTYIFSIPTRIGG